MDKAMIVIGRGAREWLSFVSTYLLVIPAGTVLLLFLLTFFGYLPCGDRPGPGWQGWGFSISWQEITFLWGFGLIMVVPAAILASVLFGISLLLRVLHVPRPVIILVGTPVCALVSSFLVASFGWLIAIGDVVVWGSLALGALFGSWRFAPPVIESKPVSEQTPGR